jgi:hypothetical protein
MTTTIEHSATARYLVSGTRDARWNTARFTIERDASASGGTVETIATSVSWEDAWWLLAPTFGRATDDILRAAL